MKRNDGNILIWVGSPQIDCEIFQTLDSSLKSLTYTVVDWDRGTTNISYLMDPHKGDLECIIIIL